jgi:hypothetical protein
MDLFTAQMLDVPQVYVPKDRYVIVVSLGEPLMFQLIMN